MKVRFMPEAENALFELGVWIEERNTAGIGNRFINKFTDKIGTYAVPMPGIRLVKIKCWHPGNSTASRSMIGSSHLSKPKMSLLCTIYFTALV